MFYRSGWLRCDVRNGIWLGFVLVENDWCVDPACFIGVDGWGVWWWSVSGLAFDVLTPHKVSEVCLEWCSFICVVFGSGGWLRCVVSICVVFSIRCYIILYYILLYIHYYTYTIIYYILYYTLLFLLLLSFLFLLSSSLLFLFYFLIHSILVGSCRYLFISQTHLPIWPRMFYRSGWLRCDVVKYVGNPVWVCVLCFELVLTLGVVLCYILYITIIIHILLLYIYYYYILYSSDLIFSQSIFFFPILFLLLLLSFIFFPPLLSQSFSSHPYPNLSSSLLPFPIFQTHLIHSILVGTYIYLFILFQLSRCVDPACFIGVDGWGV
jgi:hypothetical protein